MFWRLCNQQRLSRVNSFVAFSKIAFFSLFFAITFIGFAACGLRTDLNSPNESGSGSSSNGGSSAGGAGVAGAVQADSGAGGSNVDNTGGAGGSPTNNTGGSSSPEGAGGTGGTSAGPVVADAAVSPDLAVARSEDTRNAPVTTDATTRQVTGPDSSLPAQSDGPGLASQPDAVFSFPGDDAGIPGGGRRGDGGFAPFGDGSVEFQPNSDAGMFGPGGGTTGPGGGTTGPGGGA